MNSKIKFVFRKIGSGLFAGVGLMLAFLIFSSAVFIYNKTFKTNDKKDEIYNDYSIEITKKEYEKNFSKLTIENVKNLSSETEIKFVGEIVNRSTFTWNDIDIELELFDKNNNFIYETSEYISGNINPQNQENFMVKISSCEHDKSKKPIIFETYKIKIKNAEPN